MSSQNNNLPESFKMTEIGLIPLEWELVKLGAIASARGGVGFPPDYQGKQRGKYPFYKVSDMNLLGNERFMRQANNYVEEDIVSSLRAKPFPPDTVIFPKVGAAVHTNKKRILTSDALVDNNVMGIIISDKNRCIPEYLLCWFESVDIGEFSNPGPLPSINAHSVKDRLIPLPPLPEQKAIARVLSTIQKAIETQDKIIAAARELKKSLMRHLFTYGPVPVSEAENVPIKETEIGPVPENWEQKELGALCDITYGVQAAVANLTDSSIGIPILTNINIRNEGMIDISTLRYYPLPDNKRERLILKRGDVLFNWRSGSPQHVGKSAIFELEGEYTFSSFILRFRANVDTISNEYLFRYLNFLKGIGFFTEKRSQSSVNSVFNASLAAKIPVLLPTLLDQVSIVVALRSADKKLDIEENRKAVLQSLFKTMLHHLMTGKVRVNHLEAEVS
ncbi:restriction endonuclease subunit S [Dehalococcoides mccartyi]|uniref:restriction endonuclease subunit S n=1 Tax=Dehalococcoides mccartyi TaxID=61435 RepID=UPI0003C83046|nr:restriction endonuclease subunit S [Dehalococcoides mccartyi]AHB13469.1 type I restriction enzyme, S subunit [Dehalococcoides mccartyi GY50]